MRSSHKQGASRGRVGKHGSASLNSRVAASHTKSRGGRSSSLRDKEIAEALAVYRRRGYLIAERARILARTLCSASGSDASPEGCD